MMSRQTDTRILICLLSVLSSFQFSSGHFNLYLKHAEVRRILGLTAELFYVREGVVNDYAMGWTVPVPAHVHTLYFTWQALVRKPVLYNMAIWTNNTNSPKALLPLFEPTLNISLTGNIPENPSTFELKLPCTGVTNAEVDIVLNINVTSPRPVLPPTVLFFRRRKICLKGETSEVYEAHQDPKEELQKQDNLPILYYALSGMAGTTLVFFAVVGMAFYRRKIMANKTKIKTLEVGSVSVISTKERPHTTSSSFLDDSTPNNNIFTLPSSITVNSYASLRKTPVAYFTPTVSLYHGCNHSPVNTYTYAHPMESGDDDESSLADDSSCNLNNDVADVRHSTADRNSTWEKLTATRDHQTFSNRNYSFSSRNNSFTTRDHTFSTRNTFSKKELLVDPSSIDFRERFKMLQVERRRIRITAVVREGKFARVFRGWIQGEKKKLDQQVIIKTLKEGAPPEEEKTLCQEGARLFNFLHRNILSLYGISFANKVPPLLLYADQGSTNLKLFLQEHREKPLSATELVELAMQAAGGLTYLHAAHILHADIAARNCLVDDHGRLRLTDASLAVDLFPSDYEILGADDHPRPLKWMAYEVITDRLVSTASDVWSYGVLLWELTTLGQQPYEEVDAKDMADYLRDGYRLIQPPQCPDELYKLMALCWASYPYDRPRTDTIMVFMRDFELKLKSFV